MTNDSAVDPPTGRSLVARGLLAISRITTPISRPLSGRRFFPLWGIVYHRGRRSGRLRGTPVAVRSTTDGFVIALPFEGAQWFRNVMAAGECVVRWKGADHPAVDPQIIDWATARPWFNPIQRAAMDGIGVNRYLLVRRATNEGMGGGA